MKKFPHPDLLQTVLRELKSALARSKADPSHKTETNVFYRGLHIGYEDGIKRAIEIVNYEIGIRQNPPNINYPGKRPQSAADLAKAALQDEKDLGKKGSGHV